MNNPPHIASHSRATPKESPAHLAIPHNPNTATTSAGLLEVVTHHLGARAGVDLNAFLERVGVPRELLLAPSARVDAQYLTGVWRVAQQTFGDENVGLAAGMSQALYCSGLLNPVLRTSITLGQAVQSAAQNLPLLTTALSIGLERHPSGVAVRIHHWAQGAPGDAGRHDVECLAASVVHVLRQAVALDFRPESVSFAHAPPHDRSGHEQFFGCPVEFGSRTEIVVRTEDWDRAAPQGQDGFHKALLEYTHTRLSELEPEGQFMLRVRCAVEARLENGDTEVDTIAKVVAVSPRTLQRRLQQRGTTLRGVIESVRQQRAFELLGKRRMSLPAIASQLSFSCASAFHRAFKRWTGGTPTRFRRCYG